MSYTSGAGDGGAGEVKTAPATPAPTAATVTTPAPADTARTAPAGALSRGDALPSLAELARDAPLRNANPLRKLPVSAGTLGARGDNDVDNPATVASAARLSGGGGAVAVAGSGRSADPLPRESALAPAADCPAGAAAGEPWRTTLAGPPSDPCIDCRCARMYSSNVGNPSSSSSSSS